MLRTATAYMDFIKKSEGQASDHDNTYAKEVMDKIRKARVEIRNLPGFVVACTEYAEARREFEEAFSRLWPSR